MKLNPSVAVSPGKIIVSGEHAVVYGAPALAAAIAVYAGVSARLIPKPDLFLRLTDLGQDVRCPLNSLPQIKCSIDERYHQFEEGRPSVPEIKDVLVNDWQLYQYAVAHFLEQQSLISETGIEISLSSNIPMRSGMGSSAATLAAVLVAVAACFDIVLSKPTLFAYIQSIERLQHGCRSTIDPMVTVYGGLVKVDRHQLETHSVMPEINWYLVNTGEPSVTTGECVDWVRKRYATSSIWNEFRCIVQEIEADFRRGDTHALRNHLNDNHELLVSLGVVPELVQKFIGELRQKHPAAAKISGAGAVAGVNAGLVLVQSDEPVMDLCHQYGFTVTAMSSDRHGARLSA